MKKLLAWIRGWFTAEPELLIKKYHLFLVEYKNLCLVSVNPRQRGITLSRSEVLGLARKLRLSARVMRP